MTARTFLGEKVEFVLQCADTTLQAIRHNAGLRETIGTGDRVFLRFADDALVALPVEDR